jgi:hypothetical protein
VIYEKEKGSKRIKIKRAGPERDHPRNLPTPIIGRSAELDHQWHHQVILNGSESSCMWDRSRFQASIVLNERIIDELELVVEVDSLTSVVFLVQRCAKGFATIPPSDRKSITANGSSSFKSTANAFRKLQKYKLV